MERKMKMKMAGGAAHTKATFNFFQKKISFSSTFPFYPFKANIICNLCLLLSSFNLNSNSLGITVDVNQSGRD